MFVALHIKQYAPHGIGEKVNATLQGGWLSTLHTQFCFVMNQEKILGVQMIKYQIVLI